MYSSILQFSIKSYAAWAPGVETEAAWQAWAAGQTAICGDAEPPVKAMPALLRRRASVPGRMALEVAYRCLGENTHIPSLFCSRHGECIRSAELLTDLAHDRPLSPTAFSLSVHNATNGLFSIARQDRTNTLALAAGQSTIEHAVIEACGLLADGAPAVLLVAYDSPPPAFFTPFQDCREQPYAWAWLIQPPRAGHVMSLTWSASPPSGPRYGEPETAGLEILRFFLKAETKLERVANGRLWQWTRHA